MSGQFIMMIGAWQELGALCINIMMVLNMLGAIYAFYSNPFLYSYYTKQFQTMHFEHCRQWNEKCL
jgi:hypothetical protein